MERKIEEFVLKYDIPKEYEFRLIEFLIKRKHGCLLNYLKNINLELLEKVKEK